MNTFELSDELLNRALAVRSQAVPAGLHAQVRRAIEVAVPSDGAARRWWSGPSALRRPVLRGAMGFALLAGLLVVVMIGTLFYVGSLPPISTASPTPSVGPTPTAEPTATPSPAPLPTAGELTFDLFADHVGDSITSFKPAAHGLYVWIQFLDVGGSGPEALMRTWLPAETLWLDQRHPQACFEDSWRAWQSLVGEVANAARWMGPLGAPSEDELTRFAAVREAIETFDPAALSTCP